MDMAATIGSQRGFLGNPTFSLRLQDFETYQACSATNHVH